MPKSNAEMWKEFGSWLRAEDVAAWVGKATGAKEAVAKTSAKRASDLIAKYGPKKKTDGSEGPKTPTKKVDGSEGPKMVAKPPIKTSVKPVYDSVRRTPVTSPKPSMIGNKGKGSISNGGKGSISNSGKGSISNGGKGSISNGGAGSMTGNKGKGSISKTGTGSMIGKKKK